MPKSQVPFAEFTKHRVAPGSDHLTVALETTYSPAFNDDLKRCLSHGIDRLWIGDAKRWFISADALDRAIEVARRHYSAIYVVDGEETTELISGAKYYAPKLL